MSTIIFLIYIYYIFKIKVVNQNKEYPIGRSPTHFKTVMHSRLHVWDDDGSTIFSLFFEREKKKEKKVDPSSSQTCKRECITIFMMIDPTNT